MEIEVGFCVDTPQLFIDLLTCPGFEGYELSAPSATERQQNIYYDTPDRWLDTNGFSLRVRNTTTRCVATLKRSRASSGHLHIRDEWEVEIGPDQGPSQWPASVARDRVLEALGQRALVPLLTVHTMRRTRFARLDGEQIALLCLDEGLISAGGRWRHFRDLELELMCERQRATFDTFVALVSDRFALNPQPYGKRRRGLQLLQQAARDPKVLVPLRHRLHTMPLPQAHSAS